jgi:hypothetical protein
MWWKYVWCCGISISLTELRPLSLLIEQNVANIEVIVVEALMYFWGGGHRGEDISSLLVSRLQSIDLLDCFEASRLAALSHTGWVTIRGPFLQYPSTCKYLDLSSFPSTWQVIINTPIEPSTCSAWTQVLDLLALPSTWSEALMYIHSTECTLRLKIESESWHEKKRRGYTGIYRNLT